MSGTGKTLVRKLATKEKPEIIGFDSSDVSHLEALLNKGTPYFDFKDRVIIIDNTEKLIKEVPKLVNAINYDRNNYYLVFLRQTSVPIEVTPGNVGKIKFDDKTSTFSIEYNYEEGVWA